MSFFKRLFRFNKYDSSDGYLLPEYWQCIVCRARKAGKRATYAVRTNVFLSMIEDDRYFQELDQTDRSAAKEYAYFSADPAGAVKEPPSVAKHFEDTSGLARDVTGGGFDAVYLCDAHAGELQRAIKTLDEPGDKKKGTRKR